MGLEDSSKQVEDHWGGASKQLFIVAIWECLSFEVVCRRNTMHGCFFVDAVTNGKKAMGEDAWI